MIEIHSQEEVSAQMIKSMIENSTENIEKLILEKIKLKSQEKTQKNQKLLKKIDEKLKKLANSTNHEEIIINTTPIVNSVLTTIEEDNITILSKYKIPKQS